jgi:hypothetical protein
LVDGKVGFTALELGDSFLVDFDLGLVFLTDFPMGDF